MLWKPKTLFSHDMFNLVSINNFQRSRWTFDLSAKVAHIGVPSTLSQKPLGHFEIKFHMTTYDWLAKIYTNCFGHMTKMAIYGKNS